ncbi:hypothetical protein JCM11491_003267 [Sporobolomyces phaffii]
MSAPPFFPPVPPPWTEHKAPGGQPYWFNPISNVSTYTRPLPAAPPPPPPGFPINGAVPPPPPAGFPVHPHHAGAAAVPSQFAPPLHFAPTTTTTTDATSSKKKKEKKEKPKEKVAIEGTRWTRVTTNKGNVFYNHADTKESVWTVPDDIKDAVAQLEARERHERDERKRQRDADDDDAAADERTAQRKRTAEAEDDDANEVDEGERAGDDVTDEAGAEGQDGDEVEGTGTGTLEIEIESAQDGLSTAVPTERAPPSPAAATPVVDEPRKKKKPKPRVVSSIEELETTEDWQRQVAEQMAKEVADAEEREQKELEDAMKPDTAAGVDEHAEKLEVNQVEAAAMYKVLLKEKDINPMAPFENELPKFVNDPRYQAVKSQRDRRDVFDEYCKEKIRERRAAKAKLAQSGIKVDPLEAYRAFLSATVTSTRTHFSDFKKAHGKDARFREFGKNEGEKEKEFKKYLRDLGEQKRAAAEKAEKEFKDMLSEDDEIKAGDKWAEVKKRHASDPRYAAVTSSSLREQLFTTHLSSLSSSSRPRPATSTSAAEASSSSAKPVTNAKEDRAARAAASLREREERVRQEKSKAERNANQARGNLGKEEAEREFGQLLIDAVRDHKARYQDVASSLSQDPRFDHPALSPRDKQRLFDLHLSTLHRKRVDAIETLFAQHSSNLDTPFDDVLPLISASPHVTRVFGDDASALGSLYESWQSRRAVQAKEDFYQLLRESPILEHWGRLQKMEKREDVKLIGEEGTRNDESEDDETGAREMAEQVDLKAVHATLKNDKRYLVWSHEPGKRAEWIEDYVENKLTAPKMTVHQRD